MVIRFHNLERLLKIAMKRKSSQWVKTNQILKYNYKVID